LHGSQPAAFEQENRTHPQHLSHDRLGGVNVTPFDRWVRFWTQNCVDVGINCRIIR
jgi:hypothetical protein